MGDKDVDISDWMMPRTPAEEASYQAMYYDIPAAEQRAHFEAILAEQAADKKGKCSLVLLAGLLTFSLFGAILARMLV